MTSQKTILFWVPRIYNHDGVSQDLLRQVRLCQQNSFQVKVFCLSSEIDLGDLIVSEMVLAL
ncbi:MAG: hypothetical protein NT027_13400 [Proteobacteria bacterium]|nr:hypothetical protein [Pseudomonadota bacterium]